MSDQLNVIMYGGGVQSTAMCILAATRDKRFEKAMGGRTTYGLFCNVGDDSEHPASIAYVRDVMTPWADAHDFNVIELQPVKRSLWSHIMDHDDPNTTREPIPIRGENGMPLSRSCTADWKIKRAGMWLKDQGCGIDKPKANVAVGISVDEIERAGRGRDEKWERRVYPLLDLGLHRNDCVTIIRNAGLPVPPKSSCFFCPFHSRQKWAEMRRDEPELFVKSQLLEDTMNERRAALGMRRVYLTATGRRLSDAITEAQTPLFTDGVFNDGQCDEGFCWT